MYGGSARVRGTQGSPLVLQPTSHRRPQLLLPPPLLLRPRLASRPYWCARHTELVCSRWPARTCASQTVPEAPTQELDSMRGALSVKAPDTDLFASIPLPILVSARCESTDCLTAGCAAPAALYARGVPRRAALWLRAAACRRRRRNWPGHMAAGAWRVARQRTQSRPWPRRPS
jgi:hypothetical protein